MLRVTPRATFSNGSIRSVTPTIATPPMLPYRLLTCPSRWLSVRPTSAAAAIGVIIWKKGRETRDSMNPEIPPATPMRLRPNMGDGKVFRRYMNRERAKIRSSARPIPPAPINHSPGLASHAPAQSSSPHSEQEVLSRNVSLRLSLRTPQVWPVRQRFARGDVSEG